MNAELPHFKNGKRNSESMPTLGRGITPLATNEPHQYIVLLCFQLPEEA